MKTKSLLAVLMLPLALALGTVTHAQSLAIDQMFASLQEEGRAPRDTLVELVGAGAELEQAAMYSVANADSIGIAIVYAHEAVCLAENFLHAQQIADLAVESASDAARNAVLARVTETLNNYETGACDLLIDERNTESQAFAAAGPAGDGGGSAGGGATPPEVDDGDNDISPAQ